jgi:hypothetical protein
MKIVHKLYENSFDFNLPFVIEIDYVLVQYLLIR